MGNELHLSRRERQIMDILHARESVTVAEIRAAMPDAPGYSAVRALLRSAYWRKKATSNIGEEGPRYVYLPRVSRGAASRSAMKRLVTTFFKGSVTEAVAALLDSTETRLSDADLGKLREMIKQAEKEGR